MGILFSGCLCDDCTPGSRVAGDKRVLLKLFVPAHCKLPGRGRVGFTSLQDDTNFSRKQEQATNTLVEISVKPTLSFLFRYSHVFMSPKDTPL